MKKILIAFAITALIACKKSNGKIEEPTQIPISINGSKTGNVIINGTSYATVIIGKQTWTSINYNGTGGMINPKANTSNYGKYYTYKEAQAITPPTGWRLPSEEDFNILMRNYDGSFAYGNTTNTNNEFAAINLMSKSTWVVQGNKYVADNLSGFNALAGGTYNVTFKYFVQEGYETGFWTLPYYKPFMITNEFKNGVGTYHFYKGFTAGDAEARFNLRFVKDN